MKSDIWISADQCAKRVGLTVRTLRLYEEYGLIRPRRTEKNWRLYGVSEITRLNEILTLKRLGLTLSRITEILSGNEADLTSLLAVQRDSLSDSRRKIERSLSIIERLQNKIDTDTPVSVDELLSLATETRKSQSDSQAVLWRRYEQSRPRKEVKIDRRLIEHYVGFYHHFRDTGFVVSNKDGQLYVRITGHTDVPMFAEADNTFFSKDIPVQITFVKAPDETTRGVILHENGYEWLLPRVDEKFILSLESEIANRAKDKIPVDLSESIIIKLLSDCQSGTLDVHSMHPALYITIGKYLDLLRADLARIGQLQNVNFIGVTPNGLDIYEAIFELGRVECGFRLGEQNRFVDLHFRPLL